MKKRNFAFGLAVGLLLAAIAYTYGFSHGKGVSLSLDLNTLSRNLPGWMCREGVPTEVMYHDAGADVALSHACIDQGGREVWLYIGYFERQGENKHIFSPRHHYPDKRWNYAYSEDRQILPLQSDLDPFRIRNVIIQKGENRQFLSYWYQIGQETFSDEYDFRWKTALQALLKGQSNAFVIRLASPLMQEDSASVRESQTELAKALYAELSRYVRLR